jgi:hypothetical protein
MHRPRGPRRMLLALVVVVSLGCSGASLEASAPEPGGTSGPTPRTTPEGFEPPARPDPAPDPDRPGACDPTTAAAISGTVAAQLEAFARGDLPAAYARTSTSFRDTFDLEGFETLIRSSYGYLLAGTGHRLDECWAQGDRGYILAGVREGSREVVLRYDVVEEPDLGWRIAGAVELPGISLPTDRLAAIGPSGHTRT